MFEGYDRRRQGGIWVDGFALPRLDSMNIRWMWKEIKDHMGGE